MMKTIDIGHRNLFLDEAMTVLETEVSDAMFGGKIQAVKIIHGHGSGALRKAVREWCKNQQGRFRAVINGEDYDMFHPESASMRSECGLPNDPDFGKRNRAITYIWFL